MLDKPISRLLHGARNRKPFVKEESKIGNIIEGGIVFNTMRGNNNNSGVGGLLRDTHQRYNTVPQETIEPEYVSYEPTGGKRQDVNKGKQNKKRIKRKKKQPKKNYRNKK